MLDKVYIVTVNYKKYADTIECLESVLKSNYKNYQVIIVDNSPDTKSVTNILKWLNGDYENIVTQYPEIVFPLINKPVDHVVIDEADFINTTTSFKESVILIKADNRGFSAANNLALNYIKEISEGDNFVWLLNNDTVIAPDTLQKLVAFFDTHNRKFIVGGKLRDYYNSDKIQAIAGHYNRWIASTRHVGEGEVDSGQYDDFKFAENNYVVGASMFFPHQFINAAGLMNEEYFLYFEELDWGLTAKQSGFQFALEPKAIIYHKEGASIEKGNNDNTSVADYYSIINRLRFTKKWHKEHLFLVICSVIFAVGRRLLKGKYSLARKVVPQVFQILFSKTTAVSPANTD